LSSNNIKLPVSNNNKRSDVTPSTTTIGEFTLLVDFFDIILFTILTYLSVHATNLFLSDDTNLFVTSAVETFKIESFFETFCALSETADIISFFFAIRADWCQNCLFSVVNQY